LPETVVDHRGGDVYRPHGRRVSDSACFKRSIAGPILLMFGISALLAAAWVRRLGGLLLLLLVALPASLEIESFKVTAFELAIPLCLFIELLEAVRKGRKESMPSDSVSVPVLAFYVLALASGLWALSEADWFKRVGVLTEALAAGLAVYLAVSRLGSQAFVRVIVWSSTIGAAWALTWFYVLGRPESLNLQPPTGINGITSQTLRLGSPLIGPSNYYAGFLILSIPVTLYWCMQSRRHWLSLAIQLAAFTAALSRGGLLALGLATAIVLAIRQVQRGRLPHALTVVSASLAAFALAPRVSLAVGAMLAQRNETTLTGNGASARTELWQVALDLWPDHPFVGIGAGNWPAAVSSQDASGAHNALLQILVELGIVGFVIAILAFFAILATIWRIHDAGLRYSILAGLLGAFINSMFEAQFEGVVFTWFLGAYLGGGLAISMLHRPQLVNRQG
jgi:O-antigen ligase